MGNYQSDKNSAAFNLIDTVLEKSQISTVYQSICLIEDGTVCGYEGLSRPTNPAFPNILELIKRAEMEGRLDELDLLMMEKAIQNYNGEVNLYINIASSSPKAIEKYFEKMIQTVEKAKISLQNLVLEFSERREWTKDKLEVIHHFRKKYNMVLALDDYGVGFSNIDIILGLKPDVIKVDRNGIQGIHKDKQRYFLMKAICEYARNTNTILICEGIEEKEELETLKSIGCKYGQGYYLGRPKVLKWN